MNSLAIAVAAVGLSSLAGPWAVSRYAVAKNLVDVPNARSSHERPTPRGGGLSIAVPVSLALILLGVLGVLAREYVVVLGCCALGVAITGWIDDHGHVPPIIRLMVQVVSATVFVVTIGGMPTLTLGVVQLQLGLTGSIIAVLGIVWSTNLFNFMDGTDGLAASEAVVVGAVGGGIALAIGSETVGWSAVLCAVASAGFLGWNWPPAQIFMGDVGSGFLGFVFGGLAVASESTGGFSALVWVVLLGFFVFDATATLARRILRRESWTRPHRSHAYQRLVANSRSHVWLLHRALALNAVLAALGAGMAFFPYFLPVGALAAGLILAVLYGTVEGRHPMCASSKPE